VTVAPRDVDSALLVRLSLPPDPLGSTPDTVSASFALPTKAQRSQIAFDNPVAAASFYQRTCTSMMEILFGLPSSSGSRRPQLPVASRASGIFGRPLAYFFVTEEVRHLQLCTSLVDRYILATS
jgi:hypothetical protein